MQAILNIKISDINDELLDVVKELLLRNIEIVIRKENIALEEYDKNIPLENVIKDFKDAGYSQDFIKDLQEGFETSTVYLKK
ncbi:MAG: hypothetical protein AB7U45_11190 [Desulfamplus sp.]